MRFYPVKIEALRRVPESELRPGAGLGTALSYWSRFAVPGSARMGSAIDLVPEPNLTIYQPKVYGILLQAGPGNDINAGSPGFQKAPT
jgi:hypothetical protein